MAKLFSVAADNVAKTFDGLGGYEIVCSDVGSVNLKSDVVVMNPPFGTKTKHADREFLLKAFSVAEVVYSIHKASTLSFLHELGKSCGFRITDQKPLRFPIKRVHAFHKRRIRCVDAVFLRFES